MIHSKVKQRILVAEDNRVMGNVIRFNLSRSGFDVVLVHDGRSAMEALDRESFDLVITDYQMPHATGREVCQHVRTDPKHVGVPVVLVSAKGMELKADEMKRSEDFCRVVYKPFSPLDIVRIAKESTSPAVETA
jgi:CheY-like chemotaxis protein